MTLQNINWFGKKKGIIKEYIVFSGAILLTYASSFYNFLLFHSIAELFSIVIAGGIFVIGWNSREHMDSAFFLVVGVSFLFIGIIDLVHTLSYKGMGLFIEYGPNLSVQLWIAARYLEALSFLLAILVRNKQINSIYLMISYILITSILLTTILWGFFPTCYIEGKGLTDFKKISEYIIVIFLFMSFFFIVKYRKEFSKKIFIYILVLLISTIISELAFTIYIGVYDFSNLVGHLFKITAFYFAYKAIIQKGIDNPFILLHDKLSNSEKKFRFAFNNAADAIIWIDEENLKIINCNKAAENLLELKSADIIGMLLSEIHDRSPKEHFSASLPDLLNRLGNVNMDGIVITASNKIIPVNINASHLIVDSKRVIQELVRDITTRKKIEELNYRLASIVDTSDDAIIGKSLEGIITSWNNGAKNIYGYEESEIVGKSILTLIPPELSHELEYFINIIKKNASITRYETKRLKKDGSEIIVSLTISPIKDEKGVIIGASTISRNITEKKKIEDKLKASEEKYRNLFGSAPFGIVLFSLKGEIVDANEAISKIIGYSRENLIGRNYKEISIYPDIESFSFSSREKKVASGGLPEPREMVVKRQDGKKIWISSQLSFLEIGGEKFIQALINDITKRKRAEERLEQFVSTVSHELRTPITVLSMSIDYLIKLRGNLPEETKEKFLDGISRNISLLIELIEDLLMISKLDEEKLSLEQKEYVPLEIVQDIVDSYEIVQKERNISFIVDISKELKMVGDLKRIDQVFRILIDNAIKYSKKSTDSIIKIKACENYTGKYNVKNEKGTLFQVIDNGIGIKEKDLPLIFERFYRSSEVVEISGTGLGLNIAKTLIELHNGQIFVDSQHDKGTTFSFFFPY
ncbi:MAG: MASE3 domain-containing protein [Promethearchaeota archaeon]